MAKWYGKIGYSKMVETAPGVHRPQITEFPYFGDTIKNTRILQTSDQLNDNVKVANQISVVADPFAYDNFHSILYAEFMGTNWKVTNAEVQYPRLLLTLGGVYNGEQT